MKKLFLLQLSLGFATLLCAQNVGVGELTPTAKLTVKGSESTADGQAAAIKLQNSLSSNAWYLRAGASGTITPSGAFSLADNFGYHLTMTQGGNLGLGINSPTSKLHINGGVKLEGLNIFEFGAGVLGKELNAGKIGYNAFGQSALTIVGGGTTNINRAVFFFAEGGATFNGPLYAYSNLSVGGAVTRPPTGNSDMVPVAYGVVDGTAIPPVIINGSGNFTAARSAPGYYVVTITGETLTEANHTAVVSCVRNSVSGGAFVWSTAGSGNLLVLTNNGSDQKFSFIIYKP